MEGAVMKWTLWRLTQGANAVKAGEFDTKLEAMVALAAVRAPKSPVFRVGRDYTFTANQ